MTEIFPDGPQGMFSFSLGNFDKPPQFEFIGEGTHIQACPRIPVRKLMAYDSEGRLDRNSPLNILPLKYVESLEQNQKIESCCRHPENHEIEARYSCVAEAIKGIPDIYILHCVCGRKHRRLCVGGNNPLTGEKEIRPRWYVR